LKKVGVFVVANRKLTGDFEQEGANITSSRFSWLSGKKAVNKLAIEVGM
jgi:hypothetical protein